jgi:K+-sensing histidine kinase KdpD
MGAAVVIIAGAIGWTTTPEALINATLIATFMLALPGAALVLLAFWLDGQAATLEGRERRRQAPERDDAARHPFREPLIGYVLAVLATLAAWGLRALLDAHLPGNVPFITFFLAVAVAGWLGGFGPAIVATLMSACISRWFYMVPVHAFRFDDARQAVVIGLFVFVCIGIGMLTAALHAALIRIQVLVRRLAEAEAAPKRD